jgi:hypothetical protein
MAEAWPRKRRKEWRRLLRKSLESDQATYQTAQSKKACSEAFELYTEIECKGWKGRAGTAIAQDPHKLNYYRAMIKQGCEVGQVETQLLMLKGDAIAASIRLIRGDIAFEVKTSYSESYRKLAPGILLELLNMQQLAEGTLHFADSCTQAGNKVMEALWNDRVAVYNSVYFGPSALSRLACLLIRAYKYLRHRKTHNVTLLDPTQSKKTKPICNVSIACLAENSSWK